MNLFSGEFQQLQSVTDEKERFQLYLNKTFNKTASLIAYSCKANAILSIDHLNTSGFEKALTPEAAFQYGRNIGIAFQLVDDLLGKCNYITFGVAAHIMVIITSDAIRSFFKFYYLFCRETVQMV